MFKNYLITAYRNLARNKSYTLINIAGLGTGIAVCLIIFLVIQYELSFDQFHHNKHRIYRVLTKNDKGNTFSAVPYPLPTAVQNNFPYVKSAGIMWWDNLQVTFPDSKMKFKEKTGAYLITPSFFEIFDFPWLEGKPATAMADAHSVILSKSTASRYFGNWKTAVGKTMTLQGNLMTVTGIVADPPVNTDFQFKLLIPYQLTGFDKIDDWVSINSSHGAYVMLPDNLSMATFNKQLLAFTTQQRAGKDNNTNCLQPLSEVHFDKESGNFSGRTITPQRIRSLWLIAGFILLIACVNFINLSTAQAVNRSKEIGVRKALGSGRSQLRFQFLTETFLLVLVSILLAIILAAILIGPTGNILGSPLSHHMLYVPAVGIFLLITTIIVTLLSGFYPAIVLSGFNPQMALKGRFNSYRQKGVSLRKGLVVVQFVIAQALIIGTLLIIKQIDYFTKTSMGFVPTAIVEATFPRDSVSRGKMDYLRNTLLSQKHVKLVSYNSDSPSTEDNWWTGFKFDHGTKEVDFAAINKWADAEYLTVYQLPLAAGRNFTRSDSIREFIVNEALVKKLGFHHPEDILNKEINLWDGRFTGPIVGVLKDYHEESLKNGINPVFITNAKGRFNAASIKLDGTDLMGTVKTIRDIWEQTFPDYVFEYQFTDDRIASFYKDEKQLSTLYKIFAVIAIFLSCLGLYGLSSFMAVQRTKEVGIRKVLGATSANILYLFSKEFILLIGIAFLLATPPTWYFVHQWLENYIYHIHISWWLFAAGGIGAVLIALTTISFQALKAAAANPVKSLKSE